MILQQGRVVYFGGSGQAVAEYLTQHEARALLDSDGLLAGLRSAGQQQVMISTERQMCNCWPVTRHYGVSALQGHAKGTRCKVPQLAYDQYASGLTTLCAICRCGACSHATRSLHTIDVQKKVQHTVC